MKKFLLTTILVVAALLGAAARTPVVNLTPAPYSMTVGDGPGLTIPADYTVAGTSLPDDMEAELDKFVVALNQATGFDGKVTDGSAATFRVAVDKSSELGTEGYTLKVSSSGVEITAPGAAGLYYAFQTVKKILPANVMAGVADREHPDKEYILPAVDITDKPTFAHRGFELDCARHFHSLDQVKRMIDVMSFYKLNRFHWHLTDDQGWRIEIEKYPRLLTVSTIAPDAYLCDFATRTSYLNGKPYGPYYYTKDEMREIVEYAAERHIEVFPEIEMPGHMVAAIAAYPEFSCNPEGDHTIWYRPGVSSDVLNVANPAVIQFCKDVLTEMADVFPFPLVHIGGDETPSTAWENNADCRALMAEKGFTSPYQLQTWFTKQIADHLKTLGKQAVCWNEVVTKPGADLDLAREAGILIYDWLGGGTAKAAELGLNSVYCNTSTYYLDYPQGNENEPRSMGHVISLPTVYDAYPDMSSPGTVIGVQGNLWCEYISDPRHVEYNALPRLIAIAETGWTPREKKDYGDFQLRVSADTVMFNLLGYEYGRHDLAGHKANAPSDRVLPDPEKWVTVTTRATGRGRAGRVLELVQEGSPLIEAHGAQPGQLWTAEPDTDSDAQQWRFVPDPEGSGRVAIVCKSSPEGSVNPTPRSTSVNARWSYDPTEKHYDFILGEGDYYGTDSEGRYFYAIRSALGSGFWLNCGTDTDGLTVNCWSNPADGDGGLWLVATEEENTKVYPDPEKWVTVTTKATSRNRAGRVIELVQEGSSLIAEKGAQPGQLWTAAPSEGSDAQQWRFVPDPEGSGKMALVCKSNPDGSVNPDPGSTSVDARWTYDASEKHYDFILGENPYYGKADDGRYYYAIRSDKNRGYWLNCGTDAAAENLTVNCWSNPADGDGGLWLIAIEDEDAKVYPDPGKWMTVTTMATSQGRANRVLELVQEGSPVIAECSAEPGKVWTAASREGSEAQMWKFIPDPAGSGKMALVCKSSPNGSVNPDPGSTSTAARWTYDPATINYNFILGEDPHYGTADNGTRYYSIRSDKDNGFWLNCGVQSDNFPANCWSNPADGNGGRWLIAPCNEDEGPVYAPFDYLEAGKVYTFANASERFDGMMLADGADGPVLSADSFGNVAWRVASAEKKSNNSQKVTLVNATTDRSFSSLGGSNPSGSYSGYNGDAIVMGKSPMMITIYRPDANAGSIVMTLNSKGLTATPGAVVAGGSRPVMPASTGGAWIPQEVMLYNFTCKDTDGNLLRNAVCAVSSISSALPDAPAIEGYTLRSLTFDGTAAEAVYELTSVKVTYECRTADGLLIERRATELPVGASHTVALPEIEFFKAESSEPAAGTSLTLNVPVTVKAVYSTDAALGASGYEARIESADLLADGLTVLIYNAQSTRAAYRRADKASGTVLGAKVEQFTPDYLWTLSDRGNGKWAVYSPEAGKYVGPIKVGATMELSENPEEYAFDFRDGAWYITSGNYAWDGGQDLSLHGWNLPGHPYHLLIPVAAPYFNVSIEEVNIDTGEMLRSSSRYVPAGSSLTWLPREYEGLPEKKVTGADGLDRITSDKNIRVSYSAFSTVLGIEDVATEAKTGRTGVYDLQGRRLTRPGSSGIYIIDGRKTLVR